MLIIGVLGGVASGKSQVARGFEQCGALRIDGDRLGHEVLREVDVITQLRARWGNAILAADGLPDRQAIAQIVFSPEDAAGVELAFLEQLTHPRIGGRIQAEIQRARRQAEERAVVLDAAVMMKSGWDRFCSHLVFVEVPDTVRRARALARGWTEAQFQARERAQPPLDLTRQRADALIDNSGPLEETLQQVQAVWRAWSR